LNSSCYHYKHATNKRLFDKISNEVSEVDELDQLGQDFIAEAKRRRSSSVIDQIRLSISKYIKGTVKLAMNLVIIGKVKKLKLLLIGCVSWNLGIEMTEAVAFSVLDAQDWADKLVNGSLGDWFCKEINHIYDFWTELLEKINSESSKVTPDMLAMIKQNKLITTDLDV
jgi:hypothetical protein